RGHHDLRRQRPDHPPTARRVRLRLHAAGAAHVAVAVQQRGCIRRIARQQPRQLLLRRLPEQLRRQPGPQALSGIRQFSGFRDRPARGPYLRQVHAGTQPAAVALRERGQPRVLPEVDSPGAVDGLRTGIRGRRRRPGRMDALAEDPVMMESLHHALAMLTVVPVGLLPVIIFLLLLIYLDTYRMVRMRLVLAMLAAGGVVAVACYILNGELMDLLGMNLTHYSRWVAPIVEETLKACVVLWLFGTHRVGFLVDSVILGF